MVFDFFFLNFYLNIYLFLNTLYNSFNQFIGFECLFSNNQLSEKEENDFNELVKFYSPTVSTQDSLAELKLWLTKIQRLEKIPNTGLEALDMCNKDIYFNIHFLLKVLCTLPVSTSSPERMFSTLKRVKTYLRNTMSEVCTLIKKYSIFFIKFLQLRLTFKSNSLLFLSRRID